MMDTSSAVTASCALALTFLGCNAILDNRPGTSRESDEAGALPEPPPAAPAPVPAPVVEAGATTPSLTCASSERVCSGICVDVADPAACGPACEACPAPAGGDATCVNDTCGTKCHGQAHVCGGRCVLDSADNDPTACGTACTVCPIPPNATATCKSGTCGVKCIRGPDKKGGCGAGGGQ
jgi:hypothetical protein